MLCCTFLIRFLDMTIRLKLIFHEQTLVTYEFELLADESICS